MCYNIKEGIINMSKDLLTWFLFMVSWVRENNPGWGDEDEDHASEINKLIQDQR